MQDDKLVKRGELILLIDQREDPEEELEAMNQGKVGRPFHLYPPPHLDPSSVPGLPLSSPTANWLASPEDYPAS